MQNCSSCGHWVEIERLRCPACALRYEGRFSLPRLARLSPEHQRLAEMLVLCAGNLKEIAADGDQAVIRYPIGERACAPWFFEREGSVWRLDLTMMKKAIRFGRSNAWRFDPGVAHPYRFAFTDWAFDEHGFPRRRR